MATLAEAAEDVEHRIDESPRHTATNGSPQHGVHRARIHTRKPKSAGEGKDDDDPKQHLRDSLHRLQYAVKLGQHLTFRQLDTVPFTGRENSCRVLASEAVDQQPMSQPAVADRHLVLLELVHHGLHDAGARQDHIRALGLKTDDLAPIV